MIEGATAAYPMSDDGVLYDLAVIGGGAVLILLATLTPPGLERRDRGLARPLRRTTFLR